MPIGETNEGDIATIEAEVDGHMPGYKNLPHRIRLRAVPEQVDRHQREREQRQQAQPAGRGEEEGHGRGWDRAVGPGSYQPRGGGRVRTVRPHRHHPVERPTVILPG